MHTDFKTIMLLLSAALGMSLIIERVLEVVKGIIKRVLLSEDSPFADTSPPIEFVLPDLGYDQLDNILDECIEDIEEIRCQIETAPESDKEKLGEKAKKIEGEALEKAKKFRDFINDKAYLESTQLTQEQKAYLKKRHEQLEALIRKGELDTTGAEYDEKFSEATVMLDPITPRDPEKTARVFWLQVIGTIAGVVVCYFSQFGLFNYLLGVTPKLDWILTGILIGGGSAPIHSLIKFLTDRNVVALQASKEEKDTDVKSQEDEQKKAPAVVIQSETAPVEIDVPYSGGVDREKLETRHLRKRNPDLIIYHHTAMHSDTTFADVVRVIRDKKWLTGYSCVILKDGSIHPFCRWDRFGNHAKGFNRHSLGIALNGNFEPDPKVPFANVNGSMGIPRPTDAQLISACKVVAMWSHLYNIPLDFAKKVIPHYQVNPNKACPGSNFPEDKFKKLVEVFHNKWQQSAKARDELTIYKQKQYLYV